jgi:DNA primase
MQYYGKNKIPCGPNVLDSDAIIVVEGRADVLNLLRYGIKNTICVGGTNVPSEVAELTRKKTVTAFTDGDRGGKLIIKELLQVANIDYVARAPDGKSVEDLVQREIVRALRQKVPVEQAVDAYSIEDGAQNTVSVPKKSRISRVSKRKERIKPEASLVSASIIKEVEPQEGTESRRRPPERRTATKRSYPPEASRFKRHSDDLTGTLGARLLDNEDKVINETPVRDLVNALRDSAGDVKSVVFDGVITQRILDIASSRGIENLVGVKRGNIVKNPASVKVYTAQGA